MRHIPYRAEFDLVINMFTAFGYLEDQGEDQRVLEAVSGALKPGGCFLLDTINHAWLMRHFERQGWQQMDDGTLLLEEREYDLWTGRSNVTWTFIHPQGRRHAQSHSLRVYTLAEFAAMLEQAGLTPRQAWGSFEGQAYAIDTHRMIVLAELANIEH
jgi:SAM-dependent methyltransferase